MAYAQIRKMKLILEVTMHYTPATTIVELRKNNLLEKAINDKLADIQKTYEIHQVLSDEYYGTQHVWEARLLVSRRDE
jgi:hypothetical protein